KSTKDSFIFSFTNKNNFRTAKVAYSEEDQYSIRCYRHCGPFFGYGDLYTNYVFSYVWQTEYRRSYPTLNLPDRMNVDDYEVFQVIKK
ncbi:hypothetical protein RhiirA4_485399, partial [Rhizophagus irregularis]